MNFHSKSTLKHVKARLYLKCIFLKKKYVRPYLNYKVKIYIGSTLLFIYKDSAFENIINYITKNNLCN